MNRLLAIWQILRGRPLLYRAEIEVTAADKITWYIKPGLNPLILECDGHGVHITSKEVI